jgi:glycogen synthase
MRIAIINSYYPPNTTGGADISVHALARALVEQGQEVSVISIADSGDDSEGVIDGAKCYYLALGNRGKSFKTPKRKLLDRVLWHLSAEFNPATANRLEHLLREIRPDVVHTNNIAGFSVSAFQAAHRCGVPLVHTLRDYHLICPFATMYTKAGGCESQCAKCYVATLRRRKVSALVDGVVGISNFVLRRHQESGYFKEERIRRTVITNGFYRSGPARVEPRRPDGKLAIGYVGRLHPIKGLEHLFAALRQKGPEGWTLTVAGTGREDYVAQLKQQTPPGSVTYGGWMPPEHLFQQVDVLAVPSIWDEPLGRVVFEAFSYGIPVIAAESGGIPEMVRHGENGWLYRKGDVAALAGAISHAQAALGQLNTMRAACIASAERHDPSRVAGQYLDFYRSLVG